MWVVEGAQTPARLSKPAVRAYRDLKQRLVQQASIERRMFKVECVGCQAPYQVDEKRVPEKGLKMRCPKCGTTFKVEAPASASAAAPPSAELQASDEGIAALPAPLSKPFASAVPLPRKPLPRPGGGRDS